MCAFFLKFFNGSCLWGSSNAGKPSYMQWDDHPARQTFSVIKELGKGAFSEIVLAKNKDTGDYVALKVIFLDSPQLYNSSDTRDLLLQESTLLRRLDHPNLVKCTGIIEGDTALVLVLELLRGGNILDRLFALSHVYSERDAAGVFCQLAAAVEYLHSQGVLHRDIKPENVMYDMVPDPDKPVPTVKLVDLGLAYIYKPKVEEKGVLGSAGFVAPEIIRGGIHTPAMDVYAMGVLLFIMLVGRKPFNNTENENLRYCFLKLHDAPGLKDPRWLDLSPDAKDLLMGMLAFDPKRRLSAKEVLEHEWVVSRGGLTHRPLGTHVALAAAAVADLRRLRNICGAGVALQRVLEAAQKMEDKHQEERRLSIESTRQNESHVAGGATSIKNKPTPNIETAEHIAYLEQQKQREKHEGSVRGGSSSNSSSSSNALKTMARKIAAKSFINMHDSSVKARSLHTKGRYATRSTHGGIGIGNGSRSGNRMETSINGASGLRRSATAILLSDLIAVTDTSVHGASAIHTEHKVDRSVTAGGGGGGGGGKSSNGLSMFTASVVHLVDTSLKKGMTGSTSFHYTPSAESGKGHIGEK